MATSNNSKTIYWIVYCIVFVCTIYFSYAVISSYINQKQDHELYKQSWQYVADTNLNLVTETNETGETLSYYEISTPEQLAGAFLLSSNNSVNAEDIGTITVNYKLTNNINLSGKTWTVRNFNGNFDGGSFHIQNLSISSNETSVGFVKELKGTIKNVYFDNISVKSTANTSSNVNVGGVVANMSSGSISNVYVLSGTVTGGSYNSSKPNKDDETGGIVGKISGGTISNCINYATVNNGKHIGGIVGYSKGTISKCVNYGNISNERQGQYLRIGGIAGETSSQISLCQNFGSVEIPSSTNVGNNICAGGIVGYSSGVISQCGNNGNISSKTTNVSNSSVGGVVGSTTKTIDNCFNKGDVYSIAKTNTSSSSSYISTQKVDTVEYHNHTFYLPPISWAVDSIWYTRNSASISIVEVNAFAGGIVGSSTYSVSCCYNSGTITGGYKYYSISILETLKKDAQLWGGVGGNPVTRTFTSRFSIFVKIKSGSINGNDSTSSNSTSSYANNCVSISNKCQFINSVSYVNDNGLRSNYYTIGGDSNRNSYSFTTMSIGKTACNNLSQSSGLVKQEATRQDTSYIVKTYPQRRYNEDNWISDFDSSKTTMLKITGLDTTLFVKDKNINTVSTFSSTELQILNNNVSIENNKKWGMKDNEPYLKNFYWNPKM